MQEDVACEVEEDDGDDEVAEKILDEVAIHPVSEGEEAIANREDAKFVESFKSVKFRISKRFLGNHVCQTCNGRDYVCQPLERGVLR